MESFDTREAITRLTLDLLCRARVRRRPVRRHRPAGLPRRLAASTSTSCSSWAREHPRAHPFTIRLVKGAYWDHEVVQAAQHGWAPPVFTDRRECDRNFEPLTKRLIDATPTVRVAIASPQPALDRRTPPPTPTRAASATTTSSSRSCAGWATTRRPRSPPPAAACARYCPVGDLVAGMAYLVRRLLENTANDSFLAAHASGTDTAELLEAP